MPTAEHQSSRVLLRAGAGDAGELGVDEAAGSVAPGTSGVWEPAVTGDVGTGGPDGESQASRATDASDGNGSVIPAPLAQPTRTRARDLPVPIEGRGGQRARSGVVRGHHVSRICPWPLGLCIWWR